MGFLDSLKAKLTGGGQPDRSGYFVYARCHRCGEVIKTRLNLQNDLTRRDAGGYEVNKTLVGSRRCFERLEITLIFDEQYRLTDRHISRGEFVSVEDYEATQLDANRHT